MHANHPSSFNLVAAAQIGSAGPASGHRLLPDLSLPTALDSGVNRGLAFCLSGSSTLNSCTLERSGGSSAAAALFAGIGALISEKDSAQLACAAGSPGCSTTGLSTTGQSTTGLIG